MKNKQKSYLFRNKAKISFFSAIIVLILSIYFILPLITREIERKYPFFTQETSFYLQFPNNLQEENWGIIKAFLQETLLSEDQEALLDALYSSSGAKKGLFLLNNDLFVFTEGEFYLKDPSANSFQLRELDRFEQSYKLLSFKDFSGFSEIDLQIVGKKQELSKLEQDNAMQIAMSLSKDVFYGDIKVQNNQVILDLSQNPKELGKYTSIISPDIAFYTKNKGFNPINASFLELPTTGIIGSMLILGDFSYAGYQDLERDEQLFLTTPWLFDGEITKDEAKTLLNKLSNYLTQTFPLVIERELPDNTEIFELQRNQDQFFEIGKEDGKVEEGTLTYPHGQILYSYKNGVFHIEQGYSEELFSSTVDNSCYFPQVILSGGEKYAEDVRSMWTSLKFALGSQRILICLEATSQVIPTNLDPVNEQ